MEQIKIIDGLKLNYIIPSFQREYAWEEEEIERLLDDIYNSNNKEYCLGIITVKRGNNNYLLIDGQQRITTLYMIAISCGIIKNKSDIKLQSETDVILNKTNPLEYLIDNNLDYADKPLVRGWNIINRLINEDNKEIIINAFNNLYYYQIELDRGIKLNHYFEVMNSRGLQLNKSDIVKSILINRLDSQKNQSKLNSLWTYYEKMDNKNNSIVDFNTINTIEKKELTINEIIKDKRLKKKIKEKEAEEEQESTILSFDYFLLYVIRLYKNKDNLPSDYDGEFNLKELIPEYEKMFSNASEEEIIDYINFMIKIKRIYDNNIIKYDNKKEKWKIGKKVHELIPIQSCLRVSFVNRRAMHWLYMTLGYFYKNKNTKEFINYMEQYIRNEYVKKYIEDNKDKDYKTGFDTPIIILNYLDYIMKNNKQLVIEKFPISKKINFDGFTFKFRNSLEHFLARHDVDGKENPDYVDYLGNLALLSYSTNTRMQNDYPQVKATHFNNDLNNYSLKLQIMSLITLEKNNWVDYIQEVNNKCIDILKYDLENNNK